MKIKSFTDLIAWQKAHKVVLTIYRITKDFPSDEKFGLTNQIRRASVSITSNIAEGFGRSTGIDKNRFYAMANGSVFETQSQFVLAKDLGYLPEKEFDILFKDLEEVSRLTSGLMKSSPDRVSHS